MAEQTKHIICIVFLFLLLLIPIFYALFTAIDLEYSWIKRIAYLIVVVVMLLLPLIIFKARTYFILEGIFNFLLFPIDIASLYLNRQSSSAPFLQNILHTNYEEAFELLLSIWPLCIAVVGLWGFYFFLTMQVKNTYLIGKNGKKTLLILTLLLGLGGTGSMMVFVYRVHAERSLRATIEDAVQLTEMKFNKIYPYNIYIHIARLVKKYYRVQSLQAKISDFSFGITPISTIPDALYILVIGEASRYDHWSLNGYTRNTTPCLSSCQNLVCFSNAYTQANQTEYAVPVILSRATAQHFDLAYSEKSLIEAFKEAGFWSGIISKQTSSDFTERISQHCDYAYFYTKTFDLDDNYDAEMLRPLCEQLRDTMQMYVLHSLGSHFRYEHRYPESFSLYEPVLGKSASYSLLSEENKDPLINAYDNSIYYTDYFLHKLIQCVDNLNRPAVVMYLSDHGESFWDDARKLSLHGSFFTSEAEYHVPWIVWYSDEYHAIYPCKVEAMLQNKTTPISSEVVFYSMLDLAGIKGGIVDSTLSICSFSLRAQDTVWVHTGAGTIEPLRTIP